MPENHRHLSIPLDAQPPDDIFACLQIGDGKGIETSSSLRGLQAHTLSQPPRLALTQRLILPQEARGRGLEAAKPLPNEFRYQHKRANMKTLYLGDDGMLL